MKHADTLERLRQGIQEKRFTVLEISRLTGIPNNSLHYMISHGEPGITETLIRLERIDQAIKTASRKPRKRASK